MTCKASGYPDKSSSSAQPRLFNMYCTICNLEIAIFFSLLFVLNSMPFSFVFPKMNAKFLLA